MDNLVLITPMEMQQMCQQLLIVIPRIRKARGLPEEKLLPYLQLLEQLRNDAYATAAGLLSCMVCGFSADGIEKNPEYLQLLDELLCEKTMEPIASWLKGKSQEMPDLFAYAKQLSKGRDTFRQFIAEHNGIESLTFSETFDSICCRLAADVTKQEVKHDS